MTFLRTIYLIGLAICFGLASNFAFSQDAPTQTQNAPAAAQASTPVPNSSQPAKSAEELAAASEAALKSKLTSSEIDSGAIDLGDPALQEAINAKRAADQALVDAVIKARETAAAAQLESGAPSVEKTESAIASKIPKSVDEVKEISTKILNKLIGWLTSPAFLAQLGAIALVWFLAPIFTRMMTKRIFLFRDPPETTAKFYKAREYVYRSREFLRAIWQVALLALFAVILKAVPALGQDWLVKIAQGLAVVFLLYSVIKTFITHEMVQKLAIWIIIPLALLMVFGFYDDLTDWLNNMKFGAGEDAISAMTIVMLAIFGAIFFKAATYSNVRGQGAIRAQKSLDITTREVLAKIFQIIVFVLAGIMAFTAAGISLSGLVVVFSALSLGLGLGLQPIAANFVSGMIILFDRSVKVGDFVMMEDEKFGRVSAINMRSTTVATADGKDIIVPNTSFTEGAYENWTHDSPLQRYEVDFCVAYDTDIDALIPIIQNAVLAHEDVLGEPDLPSIEFRSFGENGINMCAEFWCLGVDDGPNKFTSDVGILIWRTLRDNKIVIPYPQRVVRTVK